MRVFVRHNVERHKRVERTAVAQPIKYKIRFARNDGGGVVGHAAEHTVVVRRIHNVEDGVSFVIETLASKGAEVVIVGHFCSPMGV